MKTWCSCATTSLGCWTEVNRMDHAFTDEMVRQDRADLTKAAMEYLATYKGSFQPILDARKALMEGYELGVAHIRTILNTMRADTSVQMEYTPPTNNVI